MNLVVTASELLSRRLGLSQELLGASIIERGLGVLFATAQSDDPEAMAGRLLEEGSEEWQMLVDEIVVPETWFFRHFESFQFLAKYVTENWNPAHPGRSFHVLCIPCASGEEAYSVIMALMKSGLEPSRIQSDAADISKRLLARARQAIYGKSSFREKMGNFCHEYFHSCEEGWHVREDIAHLVRFEKANLLDLSCFRQRAPYDAIFCRNALIYLNQTARQKVVRGISELLGDDGLLFTGSSELPHFCDAGYAPMDYPQSFACHKKKPASSLGPVSSPSATVTASTVRPSIKKPRLVAPGANRSPRAFSSPPPSPAIEQAEQLADGGDLEGATGLCQRLLESGVRDPKVYSLLGVINESKGAVQSAEEYFRKALYLAPDHYESLLHMGLLCEQRGDIENARRYRARAGRSLLRQEGKPVLKNL